MEQIHRNLAPREFAIPQGIVTETVCRISGHLASDICVQSGSVITDIFAAGTQPTQYCDSHAGEWVEDDEENEPTPEPNFYIDPYGNLQTAPPLSTDQPFSAEESFTITPRPVLPENTSPDAGQQPLPELSETAPPEANNWPSESDPIIETPAQEQNLPVIDEPSTLDGFSLD